MILLPDKTLFAFAGREHRSELRNQGAAGASAARAGSPASAGTGRS